MDDEVCAAGGDAPSDGVGEGLPFGLCLTPGCNGGIIDRGICHDCEMCIGRLVRLGRTSWEEQEKKGHCFPPKPRSERRRPVQWRVKYFLYG